MIFTVSILHIQELYDLLVCARPQISVHLTIYVPVLQVSHFTYTEIEKFLLLRYQQSCCSSYKEKIEFVLCASFTSLVLLTQEESHSDRGLHYCHTTVTLLSHYCCTAVTPLSHHCHTTVHTTQEESHSGGTAVEGCTTVTLLSTVICHSVTIVHFTVPEW